MRVTERYPFSFYLALVANLFFFSGFQWTFVTLPGYIQNLGGGAAEIGLAYGLFSLSAVLVRPGIGWLVDRLGRKPLLLGGAALFALAPALYTLVHSIWAFLAIRILHGVGIAAFTTAYITFIADLAPVPRRGEAIGLSGVTNNLGMLFAPALGVYTVARWGYSAHFALAAGITLMSVLLLLPSREPKRSIPLRSDSSGLLTVARQRPVWVAAFGITGLAVAYGAVLSFLAPLAAQRGLYATGGYFSAFALTMITAQSSAGWLSDRVGRRAVALPGLTIVVLAMIGLSMVGTNAGLLAAGAVFGLSWGLARAGIDTAVVDAVVPGARGSAIAFLYTCFDTGVGIGSFGLGVIAESGGYPAALYTSALWAAVALAGYFLWGRSRSIRTSQK
jgi:MFS family permease